MYLEPIFTANDIMKQLPQETKLFEQVHKQLKEVMRRTRDRPNALQSGCSQGARGSAAGNEPRCRRGCAYLAPSQAQHAKSSSALRMHMISTLACPLHPSLPPLPSRRAA